MSSGEDSDGLDESGRRRRLSERQTSISSESDFPTELDQVMEESMEDSLPSPTVRTYE